MYYSGNRYLTLDEMKVNAEYIYPILTANGWTINAIAGILGNMETESKINPAVWEDFDEGNMAKGFGLVQWTPASKYITEWCVPRGLIAGEMESNLQRILYEVDNNLQWGNDSLGNPAPYTFREYTQSTESAYVLGMNFLRYYERPQIFYQPNRGTQAEQWFTFLGGIKPKKKSKVFLYLHGRRWY